MKPELTLGLGLTDPNVRANLLKPRLQGVPPAAASA